ncbi:hypothetical protein NEIELOOT_01782, partial [Neisseria elongata subsp. glycolytica ATCC 29315]
EAKQQYSGELHIKNLQGLILVVFRVVEKWLDSKNIISDY